jgi:uroporphyrinogen-III synthase
MIIVCRPQPDAARSVDRLRERGLSAEARPLVERRALPIVWPEHADIVFVTSPFAARLVLLAMQDGKLAGARVAAISKRTAAVFTSEGVTPAITAEGGAEALARVVPSGHVTYPVSRAADHEPEHHAALGILRARGDVSVLHAYDTTAVADCPARIDTAPRDATWWFHSPSAVRAFVAHCSFIPARVVCTGGSALRAWAELKQSSWPDADKDSPEE